MATNFLTRWSKKKFDSHQPVEAQNAELDTHKADDNRPSVETSTDTDLEQNAKQESAAGHDESVASLLTSQVEASVKKAALRKLFMSGEFNTLDGLNDYDHNYKEVGTLSSQVAAQLRGWISNEDEEEANSPNSDTSIQELNSGLHNENNLLSHDRENPPESERSDSGQVGQNIPHENKVHFD